MPTIAHAPASPSAPAKGPAPADAPRPGPVLIDPPGAACDKHKHCQGWIKSRDAGPAARIKSGVILSLILIAFAALSGRLVQIQIFQSAEWKKRSAQQSVEAQHLSAIRGTLSDSSGLPLVSNVPHQTILADLRILNDRDANSKLIAPLLGVTPDAIYKMVNRDDSRIVYLARNIEIDRADKIRALKIRGIGFEDTYVRTYPQGHLLSHLLGFAGMDGGQEGLEKSLDRLLRGQNGSLMFYRDAARRLIAFDGDLVADSAHPPHDGCSVTLTIDAKLQQFAEEQLAQVHEEFDPKCATLVLMDPNTGAILALAATPDFDLNKPSESPIENRRCRPLTDIYEPGSTFKTIFASVALERNLWRRNEMIFCENGAWRLPQRTLHDSHALGWLSYDEVISKSSNIGAAKICQRIGYPAMYDIVRDFGFGDPTGIGFPGESRGMVRPREKWSHDSLYSVAMGHEIGVTPLQMVAAYSAVINGGTLYRPKVVQRVANENGEDIYALKPQPVRRVLSERTSREMRDILAKVVLPGGTGTKAFLPEWAVGGKTGTTKKIDPATHTYSSTLYIGSFCGFAPVDNPRLVCLVTVDEPRKGRGYYGGTVACPAVREMLRKGLTVLNVPPRSADEQEKAIKIQASHVEH